MTAPRRAWSFALATFVAMLAVPLLVWLVLPSPGAPPARQPRPRATAAALATPVETAPLDTTPTPRAPSKPAIAKEDEPPVGDDVTGTVLDSDGQPVTRAAVGCDDRSAHLTATTDMEGRFRLPAEASGCMVVAHHPQHPSSERVRVEVGKDNTVKLGAGGAIEGVVVDEQGAAMTSYRLTIELFLPNTEGVDIGARGRPKTVEDPAGAFRLEKLPPGKYVLGASAEGHPPGKSETVEVEVGQTARNVRIALPRAATLSGTVRDEETRKPIAGATLRLDGMAGGGGFDIAAPVTTDAEGAFSLVGVPPGPFSVRVERDGYKSRVVSGLTTRGASVIREDITLRARGDGGSESELEGIGAILAPTPSGIVITSLVENGPGAKAGLKQGDRLLRIDGASAQEMPLFDAIQRLRGPSGSRVTVSVSREGDGNVDVTVTRERIER
ncbi:carboxypeptidase regulatory-like domain-containing protein [Polyangium sp. 15x6]|uniref:carboxypeptidase regulatory-like domain-containing protein n=1 Tax=Polyangium sp. 15x6 TaxID=3042687 RepID=UPI00249A7E09|nr:carboxypeptidase regulatory-like domain-containing protein [Polyangium sp. 15x6]MDI3284916.1 carboxypeptidase regulatory-like domain-containing protein [Polyangium sp. 15x6]